MKFYFADTWFYLALLDGHDGHHRQVTDFIAGHDFSIVTTQWVLAETANAFARSSFRAVVAAFLNKLEADPSVRIVAHPNLYGRGLSLYPARSDKSWSLTDCISFVAKEEENMREALTGDRHFTQAGFIPLFG